MPEAEVIRPSDHGQVQAFHHRLRRLPAVPSCRHGANPAADALDARLVGSGTNVGALAGSAVDASDAVAQKLKRSFRAPQASGFPFVDRQLQSAHETLDPRQHVRRRGLAEHAQIVRVVHDLRSEALGIAQHLPTQYEAPHIEVAEQGRKRGTLRGPFPFPARPVRAAFAALAVVLLHRHFQPRLDELEHSSVADAPGHAL